MQRILVLCLVFLGLLALPNYLSGQQGQGVPLQEAGNLQLVGFTSTTFTGDQGMLTFTRACQTEFGAGSRMCSSIEVMETTVVPSDLSGQAWVRPVYQPGSIPANSLVLDASGSSGRPEFGGLACKGWSSAEGFSFGLAVDEDGKFEAHTSDSRHVCGRQHSIACCALVP